MNRSGKRQAWLYFVLAIALLLTTLSVGSAQASAAEGAGEVVPSVTILSSLPESNMVNYEMAIEVAEELQKLGVDATAQPIDFAVLLDTIYAEEYDYDAYTIGWSGRIERLDPDMFIHSINHSDNANAGGNNTNRYRNPEFDALADAQRQEMDIDKRREIVFEAQKMLAEDVPHVTLYSRANMQTYNKERFSDLINIPGEGLFNEWTPFRIKPLTDQTTLRVASNVNIDDINPLSSKSVYGWRNLRLIYDKLVRLSPEIEPVPWAASEWDIVSDTEIDVVLREGMTFHDGEPVTVEDVKFSYELFINEKVEYFASFLAPIDTVEITGDNTVRFTLKYPYAPFIMNTLAQIPILPKHVWENIENPANYDNLDAIGSGPFKMVRFQTGEELVVERFDDYFDPPIIDGYIFQIFASPEGVLSALELGTIDMVSYDLVPAHTEQIENNEGGKYDHLELTEAQDTGFFYLGLNLEKPPFNNKAFRVALAHLVDYDLALDVHLNGYGARGGGGLVIVAANEFWHNPEVPIYDTYDPERAREILEEAGFTWNAQGKLVMPEE
ncbi:MAG TPA: ABC transporter substrate-binding protein [Fastidiosipila sp.]|jgi:peptide/nickel transport system substrate-binding protein|nr:ABC transporter substrate-binding protein [Fastidiosipila sp.]